MSSFEELSDAGAWGEHLPVPDDITQIIEAARPRFELDMQFLDTMIERASRWGSDSINNFSYHTGYTESGRFSAVFWSDYYTPVHPGYQLIVNREEVDLNRHNMFVEDYFASFNPDKTIACIRSVFHRQKPGEAWRSDTPSGWLIRKLGSQLHVYADRYYYSPIAISDYPESPADLIRGSVIARDLQAWLAKLGEVSLEPVDKPSDPAWAYPPRPFGELGP